MIKKC